ncbi:hypothetical protein KL86DPRO_10326 [uncultured delta proteobacterium]|uniref:Uncharacterized protein n=1 Tax=uncultured delta proteobacterium TaxID=34034 RepID=A0A212IYF9_9DELT|nr:hypothetical protein KL86DPRO_10326 [uncultured delta proteobacterium]
MKTDRSLLTPKTVPGKICVFYFCFLWWILVNQPVLQIFNDMVVKDNVWVLGMPVNFLYIYVIAAIATGLTFYALWGWQGDEDDV